MFAVVKTGGKQYRVEEGRTITIDRVAGEPGDAVELGEILMLGEGDDVTVGVPTVAGARVVGTITEQGRAPKIVVFRYKNKTRSRKKTGHRQPFTRLIISDVLAPGQDPKPRKERPVKAAVESEAVEVAASPSAEAAPVAEEAPKRGRRRKAEPEATSAPATETPTATAEAEAETETAAEAPAAEKKSRGRKKSTE